jgi:flagellar hook-associated protein FlgK
MAGAIEGSSSFLKKRSKKLLQSTSGVSLDRETTVLAETEKSFLVLFFKKELLS